MRVIGDLSTFAFEMLSSDQRRYGIAASVAALELVVMSTMFLCLKNGMA